VSNALVPTGRKLRTETPRDVKSSSDTRLEWMWDQRLAVVANIYYRSPDILDRMAARLILDAIMAMNLASIELVLQRIEGAPVSDQTIVEGDSLVL